MRTLITSEAPTQKKRKLAESSEIAANLQLKLSRVVVSEDDDSTLSDSPSRAIVYRPRDTEQDSACVYRSDDTERDSTDICRHSDAEQDSLFGWLDNGALSEVLARIPCADWSAVRRVCRRWHAVSLHAFNEFSTSKSFMHAVCLDQRRLLGLATNRKLFSDGHLVRTVIQRARDEEIVARYAAQGIRDYETWIKCLHGVCANNNVVALQVLARQFARDDWVVSIHFAATVLSQAFAQFSHTSPGILPVFIELYPEQAAAILSSDAVAGSCCARKQRDLLDFLLKQKGFCTQRNLRRVMAHAFETNDEPLALSVVQAALVNCHYVLDRHHAGLQIIAEACRRKWNALFLAMINCRVLTLETADLDELLRIAAVSGKFDPVVVLAAQKRCRPGSALVRAVLDVGNEAAAEILLEHPATQLPSADLDAPPPQNLLCVAIRRGHRKRVVELLLSRFGADPNAHGGAPLDAAVRHRNFDAVRALLAHPKIAVTQSQFLAVLALVNNVAGFEDVAQTLIHSARFAHCHVWPPKKSF